MGRSVDNRTLSKLFDCFTTREAACLDPPGQVVQMNVLRKLRIGTKLGIAAALGVLLVLVQAGNQLRVYGLTQTLDADIRAADTVDRAVLEAEVALRRVSIQVRSIRGSSTAAEIDVIIKRINEIEAPAAATLDLALATTTSPDERANLAKSKELYKTYMAAGLEMAQAQKAVFADRDALSMAGRGWPAQLAEVVKLPALVNAPNHAELARILERIDSEFKQGRLLSWAKVVRPEDQVIIKNTPAAFETVNKLFDEGRAAAGDKAIKDGFDKLQPIVTQYKAVMDKLDAATARTAAIMKDRADPARIQADEITEKVKQGVRARSAEARAVSDVEEKRSLWISMSLTAAVLAVLVGSALFSLFNIARPIRRIGEVLLELANGTKAVDIPYAQRGDEVGDNARAAQTFKENLLRLEKMEGEQKAVEARAASRRKAEMAKLADEFQAAVGNIVDTVSTASTELEAAASTLTTTAETTQQLSGLVASASEQASANVQSVAAATEEMNASVSEIARQVQNSSGIALDAVRQAERTDARIAELLNAASRIGDVVKLITAIAEQTNLLALNATIEAARAGEAGKGFAVVAQEVKALASQTAKATDEIGTQIAAMQTATQDSVAAIKEISTTISKISEISTMIAAAVEEQGATTQEIARNVQETAHGTTQVATNITEVNRGASETGTASAQVLSSAQSLARESNRLKTEVDKFLTTVRAA
jgi:methyl-accepting chemotaxis protein